MAPYVTKSSKIWLDGFDISGDLNAYALSMGSEIQEDTALGDDTKSNASGLKAGQFEAEGYWQAGTDKIDEILYTRIGLSGLVLSAAGETGAEGELAFSLQPILGEYSPGAAIGEMMKFTVSAESGNHKPIYRGTVAHNAVRTGNGNGTAFNLGTVSATQKVYASLHVLALTGTSIAVKVQSDDAGGFGSPTDRITFTTATAKGAQYASLAGAITDNQWRANWTLVGSSVTFIVIIGIQ